MSMQVPRARVHFELSAMTDLQRDRHAAAVGDDLADAHRHRLLQEQAHLPDSAQHLQDQGHVLC